MLFQYFVAEIHTSGYLKNLVYFCHVLVRYVAQCSGAFAVVVGTQLGRNLLNVVNKPAPHGTLFNVLVRVHTVGVHAVADVEDVLLDAVHQLHLLASHLAVFEIA